MTCCRSTTITEREIRLSIGEGPLYGMVKDWAPDAFIWVNEAVFEKAGVEAPDLTEPVSEAEMSAIAQSSQSRRATRPRPLASTQLAGFIDRFWMSLAKSAGGSLYTEDFTAIQVVDNEPVVNAIKYFFDMAKDGVMSSPLNPSPAGWFGPDFTGGRLGIVWTGYWFHGFCVADPGEEFQQAVADGKVKMYPNFSWYGKRSNPCITAAGAIMTSSTKNPDAAWTAFEWFMGKEPAQDRAKSGWGLPGLTSLWESDPQNGSAFVLDLGHDPGGRAVHQGHDTVQPVPGRRRAHGARSRLSDKPGTDPQGRDQL